MSIDPATSIMSTPDLPTHFIHPIQNPNDHIPTYELPYGCLSLFLTQLVWLIIFEEGRVGCWEDACNRNTLVYGQERCFACKGHTEQLYSWSDLIHLRLGDGRLSNYSSLLSVVSCFTINQTFITFWISLHDRFLVYSLSFLSLDIVNNAIPARYHFLDMGDKILVKTSWEAIIDSFNRKTPWQGITVQVLAILSSLTKVKLGIITHWRALHDIFQTPSSIVPSIKSNQVSTHH
jgi:hypothetical protein